MARGEGKEEDARRSGIKEEEESAGHHSPNGHDSDPAAVTDPSSSPSPDVSPSVVTPDDHVSSLGFNSVGQSMAGLSLEAQNPNSQVLPTMNPLPFVPPPGLTDPASIEWSYLDPQGQVQGGYAARLSSCTVIDCIIRSLPS